MFGHALSCSSSMRAITYLVLIQTSYARWFTALSLCALKRCGDSLVSGGIALAVLLCRAPWPGSLLRGIESSDEHVEVLYSQVQDLEIQRVIAPRRTYDRQRSEPGLCLMSARGDQTIVTYVGVIMSVLPFWEEERRPRPAPPSRDALAGTRRARGKRCLSPARDGSNPLPQ